MEPTRIHWDCPRCTLLVSLKNLRCPLCNTRKPRNLILTPILPIQKNSQKFTPPIAKKSTKKTRAKKRKVQRIIDLSETQIKEKVKYLSTNKRAHEQTEKQMNKAARKKVTINRRRGEYTIDDVKRGLYAMLKGSSARQAEKDVGVPMKSLRRNFVKCLGFKHSTHCRIARHRWDALEKKIASYELQVWGGHSSAGRRRADESGHVG